MSTKADTCPLCGAPVEEEAVNVVNLHLTVTVEQEDKLQGGVADLLEVLGKFANFLWAVVRGCFKVFILIVLGGLIGASCAE